MHNRGAILKLMNLFNVTRLSRAAGLRRKSGLALIMSDGKLLVFLRKRFSRGDGKWIEYYSIPGGGVDPGETPAAATIRELQEEMGVTIEIDDHVAHGIAKFFEHDLYTAHIIAGEPQLMPDSEEALRMNNNNQFIVKWVDVNDLSEGNMRYYADYLPLIRQIAAGTVPKKPLQLKLR